MKRIVQLVPLLLLLFLSLNGGFFFSEQAKAASGRAPGVEWSQTPGKGEARFVEQTTDGGYVVTGWIESRQEGSDVFLARYDEAGNELWLKSFRGNGYSCGYCVREVSRGGFIVAGETKSRDGFDHDVYVLRTDEKGRLIWERDFGGKRCDYGWSVQQTKDGGFIIAGGTESFGAGIYDVYLIKLASSGKEIWEKTYGGAGSDCGYAIQQLKDGGYLIAGNTDSFGGANPKLYLIKTDGNGKMIWQRTYGGKGSNYGWSLLKASDGGYLIAGEEEMVGDEGGGLAAYLIKVDHYGNELWEKTYGGKSGSSFYAASKTKDGYVLTGNKGSAEGGYNLYVVKTNKNGDPVWEKTIKGIGCNTGYAVLQSRDSGYVIVGRKGVKNSAGSDILLLKLQPDAELNAPPLWVISIVAVALVGALLIFLRILAKKPSTGTLT